LKKAEDKLASLYDEIEENKEDVKNLEAKLGELEVEATKVMEAYQESQVKLNMSLD
jgi:septal ring factor EnvC (AmiA/AmiB activator)